MPLERPQRARFEHSSVLVCFAVRQEATFFSAPQPIKGNIRVLLTGMGHKNAAKTAQRALDDSRPELVLTCGFAGGLKPYLPLGAIVFSADMDAGLDSILVELGAIRAQFHCSTRIASRSVEKRSLWESTRADAVEMESGVIRQICLERKIPSATVRAISDTAQQDLPLDFNALMTPGWQIDYRKLLWKLLRRPGTVPALLAFQRHTKMAARNLGQSLQELLRRKYLLTG